MSGVTIAQIHITTRGPLANCKFKMDSTNADLPYLNFCRAARTVQSSVLRFCTMIWNMLWCEHWVGRVNLFTTRPWRMPNVHVRLFGTYRLVYRKTFIVFIISQREPPLTFLKPSRTLWGPPKHKSLSVSPISYFQEKGFQPPRLSLSSKGQIQTVTN